MNLLAEKLENIVEDYQKNQYPYSLLPKKWRSKRSMNDHMSHKEDEEDRLLVKAYACNKENFITKEEKIRKMNARIIEIQYWRTRNWYEREIVNQIVEIYRARVKVKLFGIEKNRFLTFIKLTRNDFYTIKLT